MSASFLYFILILGIIVMIHEVGHLLTAKAFNVYCKEFAIGMGPKLFAFKGKETTYSLRLFPFGGYVAMAGEEGVEGDVPFERSIKGIAAWKRMLVMLAGIAMNVVLASLILIGLYIQQGQVVLAPKPVVDGIIAGSPAEAAGFMAGDKITEIRFADGLVIQPKDFYEIVSYVQMYTTASTFTVDRNGTLLDITVTPAFVEAENRYFIGLMIPEAQIKPINAFEAVGYGLVEVKDILITMGFTLINLAKGIGLDSVSGPIGIYQITAEQAKQGIGNLVYLTALLSLNVALFNLLPLPVLDGGRTVLVLYEMIFRKPVSERVEQALMAVSVSLLILLMVLVTWKDLVRLF